MTNEWELHREVLKSLYLENDRPLEEVRKHLAQHHDFKATKAQYESQFKKWNWNKNWKKDDWKYVARKFDERHNAGKESAVYRNGIRIRPEKVKKEISRHVHPNDRFSRQVIPPSPEYVTVRTPPGESMTEEISRHVHLNDRFSRQAVPPSSENVTVCTPLGENMTSSLHVMNNMISVKRKHSGEICVMQQRNTTSRRIWIAPDVINLDDLPFFQFQRLMKSQNVIEWFEKIVTVNDPLAGNIVAHYWPRSSSLQQSKDDIHLFETNSILDYHGTNDGFDSLTAYSSKQDNSLLVCKPFGIELLDNYSISNDWDIPEWFQKAQMTLPALLANMPRMQNDDLQQSIKLLLGSPTVTSLRSVVEIGVYLSSNNMERTDSFIKLVLEIVPWTVLKLVFSNSILTIRAFAESALRIATSMKNVEIVKDLLRNRHLRNLLKSSGEILIRAVQSSNNELVRLLLHAKAKVDLIWRGYAPLVEAKTVEIARMLVEAGVDVNAFGTTKFADSDREMDGFPLTALCVAVRNNDVNLARYLISAKADVNLGNHFCGSPLRLAASGQRRELFELLLKHGAHVKGVLQHAAISGNLDYVRLLVKAGADVNASGKITALQAAAIHGHSKVVTFLLDHGAKVNAAESFEHGLSKTVLTAAVENNNVELVEIFLNAGADVNIPSFSYHGCNVLEVTKSRPASSEIVNLLVAKGLRDSALTLNSHHKILLYDAVCKGDLDRVKFLINLGLQIDLQMIDYQPVKRYADNAKLKTILHLALDNYRTFNMELFRFLLGKIKDVNAQIKVSHLSSVLVKACEVQGIELAEMLIDAGADVNGCDDRGNFPLLRAIGRMVYRDDGLVHFLLRKGADVNAINKLSDNATTALQESLRKNHIVVSYFLLAYGAKVNASIGRYGSSELGYAAAGGNIPLVRELLDRGANVNSAATTDQFTALQIAARRGDTAMVELLLEKGADINAPGESTALQAAAETGETATVQLLLEKGADVNAPGFSTALQSAIEYGNFQLTLLLLEADADINAQARERSGYSLYLKTALETAAYYGRLDILHLLLKVGADMHLPVEERYVRAVSLAREKGHIVIAEILEGWNKDESGRGNIADWVRNSKRPRVEKLD